MQKTETKTIAWTKNNFYSSDYNQMELSFFRHQEIAKVHAFQKTHEAYTETPLFQLKNLAKELNVADIRVKDESYRFGLNAFKVMGGIYAMAKCIADKIGEDIENLSFDILKSEQVKEQLGDLTFISATDGNHGRGVAWAARELGYHSVIYMPKGSSHERLDAIRKEGAEADITDLNYDDAVRYCADLAEKNNWIMVQDTAWEGYDEIPLWIMQGYAAMAKEVTEQLDASNGKPPTHVFLQAGVGSFAGAIAAYLVEHYREEAPRIMVVEPHQADCYYRSFSSPTGQRELVTGDMDTIMAGLACGEPNTRAFRVLRQYASASFSCDDRVSALGMRIYSSPIGDDSRIISGESGAVTLGLFHYLRSDSNYIRANNEVGLDENSRVLLISTEGDTDAKHYRDVVWKGHYPNQ
ncbi:diaminopropionate ammonia-lyase [Thalassobacillus sp. B23F22_16]|uniref:diaminopropionate ammonia-lyase n=1 Tax=Thalassobacillus sp. B23F22_16 TaxID=3459513 RepID=UPI00373F8902